VAPLADLFLYDLKMMDNDLHRHWTGEGNELVLENLCHLVGTGANVVIRVPIVPGCNDDLGNALTMTQLMRELGLDRVQLLPLHKLGVDKFQQIGRVADQLESLSTPSAEQLARLSAVIRQHGVTCISQ
jgi:pyruvate formate lyase activating enzyme